MQIYVGKRTMDNLALCKYIHVLISVVLLVK